MVPRGLELSCSPSHLGMELIVGGEVCILVEVWRRQVSCLLFLSSQVLLFFRVYIRPGRLLFFFNKEIDRIISVLASMQESLASMQESLPSNFLSCWFAWCCLRAGKDLSCKLLH